MSLSSKAARALIAVGIGFFSFTGGLGSASASGIAVVGTTSVAGSLGGLPSSAGPDSVAVSGHYALVANASANSISVVDVSNPVSPTVVGTTPAAGSSGGLAGGGWPTSIAAVGHYGYLASMGTNSISVVDVSDVASPVVVGTTPSAGSSGGLPSSASPDSVTVAGNYAYVANNSTNSISVVDVSDATHPVVVGTTPAAGSSGGLPSSVSSVPFVSVGPMWVAVAGNFVYVATDLPDSISVVDVSDPTSPVVVGTTPTAGSSGGLPSSASPNSVTVAGNFAYVADEGSDSVSVVDVSDAASPAVVGTTPAAGSSGGLPSSASPYSVAVSGNVAFVVNSGANSVSAVNVSDPTSPVEVGTTPAAGSSGGLPTGGGNWSIALAGTYAYVTNYGANSMSVVDVRANGAEFTATFNAHGGRGTMTSQTGSTATALEPNTFTRNGYTFTGWNTAADGSGTSYADRASFPFTTNVTLYAQWAPDGLPNTGSNLTPVVALSALLILTGVTFASARRRRVSN